MVTTKDIKIGNHKKAYVVFFDGMEVGTISQHATGAVWVVYRGVGTVSRFLGTTKTKKEAIQLLSSTNRSSDPTV